MLDSALKAQEGARKAKGSRADADDPAMAMGEPASIHEQGKLAKAEED